MIFGYNIEPNYITYRYTVSLVSWIMEFEKNKPLLLKYKGKEHDLSTFKRIHPGGSNTLELYRGKSIDNVLLTTHHSMSAYNLIKEYSVNKSDEHTEEDLEKLIDWTKPILKQVGSLRGRYKEWVLAPVDRKMRLFTYDFLEALTVTKWYFIVAFWFPVITLLMYSSYTLLCSYPMFSNFSLNVILLVFSFIFGICIWPFMEYIIHRWLFHMMPPDDSPALILLHFTMHGLHHKVPFDHRRLLFPPIPGFVIASLWCGLYMLVFPFALAPAISAGTVQGYVIYDLMHYYLHYGSPKEGTYLYLMKRYHNQHHFVQHDKGFGVSNRLIDHLFETVITLKELTFGLKW